MVFLFFFFLFFFSLGFIFLYRTTFLMHKMVFFGSFFIFFFFIFFLYGSSFLSFGCFFFFSLSMCKVMLDVSFLTFFFNLLLLVVGGFILLYSNWYFSMEPKSVFFVFFLIFFVLFMFFLTNSNSIFFILVSWESVGIMSFLLICWWSSRSDATLSSVQAIMYNRFSDFGFYLCLMVIFFFGMGFGFTMNYSFFLTNFLSFFLIFAIIAKSSQFFFHPWLPNAMESPTPVSSLLHSSTMVVASVFVLIRLSENLMGLNMNIILFFSSLTMIFSALCGISQQDIKKIIAFSTTSQLGFMVMTVVVVGSEVSFFLLVMHAFFKSLLFMSSGVFIHSTNSEQCLEKMSMSFLSNSLTFLVFVLSSLSLMSFPFFSSFFSKDLIIENMWGPITNRFSIVIFVVASCFTVSYSFRLILVVSLMMKMFISLPKISKMEFLGSTVFWKLFLGFGSIFFGFFFQSFFFLILKEEYLNFIMKFVPIIIIFFSVFFCFFFIFNCFFFFSFYMFFFNFLVHRFYSFLTFFFVSKYVFFEFFFFEQVCMIFFLKPVYLSIFFIKNFFSFSSYFFFVFFFFFIMNLK